MRDAHRFCGDTAAILVTLVVFDFSMPNITAAPKKTDLPHLWLKNTPPRDNYLTDKLILEVALLA